HVGGGEDGAVDLGVGHTVDDHGQAVLLDGGGTQQVIQVLAGDLGGVLLLQHIIVDIGADFLAVVLPVVGGTAEHVGAVPELQVAAVQLLAQLDVVLIVLGDVGGAHIDGVVLAVGAGAGGVL